MSYFTRISGIVPNMVLLCSVYKVISKYQKLIFLSIVAFDITLLIDHVNYS